MVLNFGLLTKDSSRHLSISNHNVRSTKKRHASAKDYTSSSEEDSLSECDSIDSEFVFGIADRKFFPRNRSTTISTLNSEFVLLEVSSLEKKRRHKHTPAKKEEAPSFKVLVDRVHRRNIQRRSNKAGSAVAAVAQIRSKLQVDRS